MAPNFEVIVGTYEQFLLGYTVDDVVNKYKMEQSFATHSHLASIRSVASNKHYLASAAADDTVCLYDMRTRTENGKLTHHNDTVNSILFTPDASHIITTSSDGSIGVIRCGNWQVEKHWLKSHKGFGVDALAVHPTGKLAMTTGRDGVLRTWNLVKGRQAYATNLVPRWKIDAKNINVLKWSPNGNNYLLAANNRIDIYSVESAGIEEELSFESKVVCVEYLDNEYIAIGLNDGKISIYNVETKAQSSEIQAHNARVKCLAKHDELLVSASSSGEIKLWSYKDYKLILLNTVDCNARISCLALNSCLNIKYKKEEIDVEKVSEDTSNKLRLKQKVIIEDEGDDEKKVLISQLKSLKRKRKLNVNNNNNNNKNATVGDDKNKVLIAKKKNIEKKSKLTDNVNSNIENVVENDENKVITKKNKNVKKHKLTDNVNNSNENKTVVNKENKVIIKKKANVKKQKLCNNVNNNNNENVTVANDENSDVITKKKKNEKKHKLNDNVNNTENATNIKKFKLSKSKNTLSTKQKGNTSQSPIKNLKKKNLANSNKKRKNIEKIIVNDTAESSVKKKKKKI